MSDHMKKAKKQAEATFEGFMKLTQYTSFGLFAALLIVAACEPSMAQNAQLKI
tara:strand:- start:151 stop:309 length:159 start_codon:yes stop_codon:yes gene_type:complete